jgi:7,8-dihydropterin-6-yl-methyl-4-(beta-D-ribofuranosyl)aminobenzene 5'-phosphate synthase
VLCQGLSPTLAAIKRSCAMKIITLVENTTNDKSLKPKHGLSIYIETPNHKVLFDLGPKDAFIHNAKKLGIDLAEIDTAVISHGHFDHGGALANFLKVNSKAKIYLHRLAFEPHYIKVLIAKIYIGLDKKLAGSSRFILTDDTIRIDDELFIFSDVEGKFSTKSNDVLLKKTASGYVKDDFFHEQNLIVTANDKAVLFSGCSHKGIANILRTAKKHQPTIQAVFGGFHLCNPVTKSTDPPKILQQLAMDLSAYDDVIFYTGHCTGNNAFERMRNSMGEKIQHLSTGAMIEI